MVFRKSIREVCLFKSSKYFRKATEIDSHFKKVVEIIYYTIFNEHGFLVNSEAVRGLIKIRVSEMKQSFVNRYYIMETLWFRSYTSFTWNSLTIYMRSTAGPYGEQ